ncbi:hypothetical protein LBK6_03840 [Leptospira borgpetersenii serovar Hardjo]|nr:hypothetical protein LBK6_03840 [Leptospira borgpetersenii serovar Hardjo]AWV69420.1 hypothetical protein B9T54_04160 [Leptospira borgpetersenii serovar Hardjo-bovis]TQE51428.1 hypothetical protein FFZ95_14280 [Leptospira borgpetersenii]AMX60759.1 hypothetical protein LBK9_03785 [Leptospira borgpetersenii serovar Hardjo]AMX64004.1 hypothetical protein LBK30_03830 [Leptospira borgpetersenii serovar Hardjo]
MTRIQLADLSIPPYAKQKNSDSPSLRQTFGNDTKFLKGCKYNRARGLKADHLAMSERIFCKLALTEL